MSLKLLICGDVKGKLDEVYKKISIIEKKNGKFDSLFCVGNFFGEDASFLNDYLKGKKTSSVETFIISQLPDSLKTIIDEKGSEICKNMTYLGNKGIMKFQNKLNIAFLSSEQVESQDIKEISNQLMCTNISYSGIDILFTNLWPSNIEVGSNSLPDNQFSSDWGSDLVSALAALVQPRYHFTAGKEMFYERQPYKNQKSNLTKPKHVTRFIALSSFKNHNNDKYCYAMQLTPMELMSSTDLLQIPNNTTDNPFSSINIDSVLSVAKKQFFYDMPDRKRKVEPGSEEVEEKKKRKTGDGCWFCLGNPEVQKHLIVHIGNEIYTAMSRGPLSDQHMMILTVGHYQSYVVCPKEVMKEIRQTMRKISSFYASQRKAVVFFERNFKTNHFSIQVVPIDDDQLEDCKALFLDLGANIGGPGDNFREIPSRTKLEEIVQPHIPYFYVEFSDGTKIFGAIPRSQLSRFDLQFGRVVLSNSKILNCPHKIQWKDHTDDRETEEKMVRKLKYSMSGVFEMNK